jgi:NitT/TauT family transport system permease protein
VGVVPRGVGRLADHRADRDIKGVYARYERFLLGSGGVVLCLGLWEAVAWSGAVPPLLLSSPTSILAAGLEMAKSGELALHLWISGQEFLIGFLLAAALAVPLGLAAGWYRRLGFVVDPFVVGLYATPRVALLPLLVLWVGVGLWSKVAVVFLSAFFPICINVIAGVKTVDQRYLRVARTFQADDIHVFRTIVLPSCLPFVLAGLRLAIGRGLVGVVVAEMLGASAGIGYLIMVAGTTFQTDKLFVGVILIGGCGLVCHELLTGVERRLDQWRPRSDEVV